MDSEHKKFWEFCAEGKGEESLWRLTTNPAYKPVMYTDAQIVPDLNTSLTGHKNTQGKIHVYL